MLNKRQRASSENLTASGPSVFEVGDIGGYWDGFLHNLRGPVPIHIGKLDAILCECFAKIPEPKNANEIKMYSAAFSGFRAGCVLAAGGAAMHVPPVLRTSLEATAYGVLFGADATWARLWEERHDKASSKERFRKHGLSEAKKQISKINHGFEKNFTSLHQMLIDIGGHPNVLGVDSFMDSEKLGDGTHYFRFHHLANDEERGNSYFVINQVGAFLMNIIAARWKSEVMNAELAKKVMSLFDDLERVSAEMSARYGVPD